MVSWLTGSITLEIGDNFVVYSTATEIWSEAKEMYFKKDKTSELYELEAQFQDIKQGYLPVSKYYSLLQQNGILKAYSWACQAMTSYSNNY